MCGFFFFFFQAEDGIRDGRVTGVQTCALPIRFSGSSASAFSRISPICSILSGVMLARSDSFLERATPVPSSNCALQLLVKLPALPRCPQSSGRRKNAAQLSGFVAD